MIRKPLLPWIALLLAGCASEERAAGSGGGIEIPNGIEMTVSDSFGRPVAGARVRVVAGEDWASLVASGTSPVLDSFLTDDQGRVKVPRCGGNCWIEAVSGSAGARERSPDGSSLALFMYGSTALGGQIPSTSPRAGSIRLAGTALSARVDAAGRFSFDKVLRGAYTLVAEGFPAGPLPAGSALVGARGVEDLQVDIDTSALLLDDFSDLDLVWAQKNVFGPCYWWHDADGDKPKVFGVPSVNELVIDSAGTRQARIRVDTSLARFSWANFGLYMGDRTRRLPDLEHLRAVHLRVRGAGSWQLKLNRDSSKVSADLVASIPLTGDWTDVRLPLSSFSGSGTKGWRLQNFVFESKLPGEIEIDRVALEGVSLRDWRFP